jgi:hypothetical protein
MRRAVHLIDPGSRSAKNAERLAPIRGPCPPRFQMFECWEFVGRGAIARIYAGGSDASERIVNSECVLPSRLLLNRRHCRCQRTHSLLVHLNASTRSVTVYTQRIHLFARCGNQPAKVLHKLYELLSSSRSRFVASMALLFWFLLSPFYRSATAHLKVSSRELS